MIMASLAEAIAPIETVPEWAPAVTAESGVSGFFRHMELGYDDMAQLVEDEGVSRQHLQDLHIHFAEQVEWGDMGLSDNTAYFFPKEHLSNPFNSFKRGYLEDMIYAPERRRKGSLKATAKSVILISVWDAI